LIPARRTEQGLEVEGDARLHILDIDIDSGKIVLGLGDGILDLLGDLFLIGAPFKNYFTDPDRAGVYILLLRFYYGEGTMGIVVKMA
jgi:hypothetical protein